MTGSADLYGDSRTQDDAAPIRFIDPATGEYYDVKPAKHTVDAAWKCGFMPATSEDFDRSDEIDGSNG